MVPPFETFGEFSWCLITGTIKMLLKDVNDCPLSSKNKTVDSIFDRVQLQWATMDSSFLTISLSFPIRVVNNSEVRYVRLQPVVDEHVLKEWCG